MSAKKIPFIFIGLFVLILILPLNIYLSIYSKIKPQALLVNNQPVSWEKLQQHISLVEQDKTLRSRAQILDASINQAVELALIKQNPAFKLNENTSVFDQLTTAQTQVNQTVVNWRTGGYFIVRFADPQASESASLLKERAFNEINALKNKLNQGIPFQTALSQAEQNGIIKQLNKSAFLPGMYMVKVTPDQFPLAVKTLRNKFFSMPSGTVSDVLTLSWDDYDGPTNGQKFTGEFAFAVIKIDDGKSSDINNFQDWLAKQKQQAKINSFVPEPFFFKWF